ncbi:hypothetical protein AB7C87_16385 [Natrarchaeobius sp. A-rgal3]|uniref:DUF7331 family protein n=1 Tax=Natrarchaeobius versutus TaxID=1679078 RepID=UPI00350F55D9
MSDVSSLNDDDVMDRSERRTVPEGTATIESYETEKGVVFYDAENPLAWVETSQTLTLEELA